MTDPLKPCWCGGKATIIGSEASGGFSIRVNHLTRDCFVFPCNCIFATADDAAAAWNARPVEDALRVELASLRAVVDAAVQWADDPTDHEGYADKLLHVVRTYLAPKG